MEGKDTEHLGLIKVSTRLRKSSNFFEWFHQLSNVGIGRNCFYHYLFILYWWYDLSGARWVSIKGYIEEFGWDIYSKYFILKIPFERTICSISRCIFQRA